MQIYIARGDIEVPDQAVLDAIGRLPTNEVLNALDRDEVIEFITGRCSPDDVFSYKALLDWAVGDGFVRGK